MGRGWDVLDCCWLPMHQVPVTRERENMSRIPTVGTWKVDDVPNFPRWDMWSFPGGYFYFQDFSGRVFLIEVGYEEFARSQSVRLAGKGLLFRDFQGNDIKPEMGNLESPWIPSFYYTRTYLSLIFLKFKHWHLLKTMILLMLQKSQGQPPVGWC